MCYFCGDLLIGGPKKIRKYWAENDTFSVKAWWCKFLVASSFSPRFTPLARPKYKYSLQRPRKSREAIYMQQEKNMLLSPMALSSSKPMAKQWFLPPKPIQQKYFQRRKACFAHGKMVFALLPFVKLAKEKFDRKSPPVPLPSANHNLHLYCKSWQNLDKHLSYILYGQNLSFVQVLFRCIGRGT